MLDVFSYNAFQTHIMPLWVFVLIVIMVAGGVILGIYFFLIIRKVWRLPGASFRE
jgi:hypothetical protein